MSGSHNSRVQIFFQAEVNQPIKEFFSNGYIPRIHNQFQVPMQITICKESRSEKDLNSQAKSWRPAKVKTVPA